MRYIAKNITVLNLLLGTALFLFLTYFFFPLLGVKAGYRPPVPATASLVFPAKVSPPVPSPLDYAIVAEANLFHPERRVPPEKKEEKEIPRPELVLYGTLVTDDVTLAYVEDKKLPYTTPGRGKRQRVLRKGDIIGGFILKEVEATRITLVRNQEVMTVRLDTAKERGGGQAQATAAPASTQAVQKKAVPPQGPRTVFQTPK